MTSGKLSGSICQEDISATTPHQKTIRHDIESLLPPLSLLCVEITVNNVRRGRIKNLS